MVVTPDVDSVAVQQTIQLTVQRISEIRCIEFSNNGIASWTVRVMAFGFFDNTSIRGFDIILVIIANTGSTYATSSTATTGATTAAVAST